VKKLAVVALAAWFSLSPSGSIVRTARAAATCFSPLGSYLGWEDAPPIGKGSNIQFDAQGVPMVLRGGSYVYNPVTISQYGLQEYSIFSQAQGGVNFLKYSERLDNPAWQRTNESSGGTPPGVTGDVTVAPDGAVTADRIDWGAAPSILQQNSGLSNEGGATFTFSIYLRSDSPGTITMRIFTTGGSALIQRQVSVTTNWQRFTLTGTLDTANSGSVFVRISKRGPTDTATSTFAWGAQLERSISAGIYAKTTATPVNGPENYNHALIAATWLRDNQDSATGKWFYNFDFPVGGMGVTLAAPWASAMAQGQAISLLVRIYDCSGDDSYLGSARHGLDPLAPPVSSGGLSADFFGHPYYEEYPTTPPSFTLNGFMFTLVGLRELDASDPTGQAGSLFDTGFATLRYAIPFYDLGNNSTYHLGHITNPPRKTWVAPPSYHCIHVHLLEALTTIRADTILSFYRDLWRSYVTSGQVKCPSWLSSETVSTPA
jgi:hypothetical protein